MPAGMATPLAPTLPLPTVPRTPASGPLRTAGAAAIVPVLLLILTLIAPFAKDAESAVVSLVPTWFQRLLRTVPATWELFTAWEFAVTALAVGVARPRLAARFLDERGMARVSYGPRSEQCMLIFGHGSPRQPRPVVVFVHGGSWSHSKFWMFKLVGRQLADMGYATAVLGYGQYPGSTVPEMVADIQQAVTWLREHGVRHGADASRLVLLGHSSGGHLCALTALAGGGLGLAGVATLSSPFDITDHYAWEQGRGVADMSALYPAHGGEAGFAGLSPTQLVAKHSAPLGLPPFYLGHGTADPTVPAASSERFAAALEAAGAAVELCRWPDLGHFNVLAALMGAGSKKESAAVEGLMAFLRRTLLEAGAQDDAPSLTANLKVASRM